MNLGEAKIQPRQYQSGNAGIDDMLYEVAYAACYDDDELRGLAQAFEKMSSEWKVGHARDIYRRVGDRDNYLELRTNRMEYGADCRRPTQRPFL